MNRDDKILKEILKKVKEELKNPTVDIPEKEEQVKKVYEVMKKISKGKDLDIRYSLHDPFPSLGYVTIEGKSIEIKDPFVFSEVSKCAANINIYPKTNGKVCLDLTFHGLAKKGE